MTRSTYKPPGVYPDMPLEEYLALTDRDGWPVIHSHDLRNVRLGPREYQHRERFGIEPSESMKTGANVHRQILTPAAWLTDVVVWDKPVLEPLPALKWEKRSPDYYVASGGAYLLERTEGGDWRASAAAGDYLIDTVGTVTVGKATCKAHYEKHATRQPKLDDDGNPKLSPMAKTNGAFRDFCEANPGREPVTKKDIAEAKRIADAVRDNPEARRRLGQIWRTEFVIIWEDPETGALMACRHDWLTDPRGSLVTLGELKTGRNVEEGPFNRAAADYEYHGQAAHYRAGFRAHFGERIETESICLAVANAGSHDSCVYSWPRLVEDDGRVSEPELDAGAEVNAERLQELLEWRDRYGDEQWPCRREAAHFDFASHGRGELLGDEGNHGGLDLSGVERHGEE